MEIVTALALFVAGAALAIWATERLLDGLVGLATELRLAAFAVGAVLSGFEVENVAVGLAAGGRGTASVALGTVFGGAIFLVCVALGLAAIFYPLEVRLPRGVILLFAASPVLAGLGLAGAVTPRWAGAVLLMASVAGFAYLVVASRRHQFLDSEEVEEAREKRLGVRSALGLTGVGLAAIAIGGELVTLGAERIIVALGVPALLMGMVITPAAIEIEEVFRQAVPSRRGRHDVAAGNLVGTLLYFLLFNLGLIALLTPVRVDPLVRSFDWPYAIGVTWFAAVLLWQGRVGRVTGAFLLAAYAGYAMVHAWLRPA